MKKSATSETDWLKSFSAVINRPEERLPPPGYVSMEEMARACGKSHPTSTFKTEIGRLIKEEKMDRHNGTRYDKNHRKLVRRTTYKWIG